MEIPTFRVIGSSSRTYKKLIKKLRRTWGKTFRRDVRTLPNVGNERVFPLHLVGNHGELVLIFRQRDAYSVSWGKKKKEGEKAKCKKKKKGKGSIYERDTKLDLYIFSDSLKSFKELCAKIKVPGQDLVELVNAHDCGFLSDYGSLTGMAGLELTKIELGKRALLAAVGCLSQMKTKNEVRNFSEHLQDVARSCLVIIQMFSECSRFEDVFELVRSKYDKSVYITDDMEEMETNWSSLSKDLKYLWSKPGKLTQKNRQQCENLRLVMWNDVKDIDKYKKPRSQRV